MTHAEIKNLSIGELTDLYNKIAKKKGRKPVEEFSSKESARQRVLEIEFYHPFTEFVKDPMKGSLRRKVCDALRRGCVHEEVMFIISKDDKEKGKTPKGSISARASGFIRTLHKSFGYGVELRGNKIFLLEK